MSAQADALRAPSVSQTVWLACACGVAVANLYYNQPMLALIGASFGHAGSSLGVIAMCTQIGYACGLVLFGPLGDRMEPRRLIGMLVLANIASLLLCASAPNFAVLLAASVAIGLTAITAQIIIPTVSGLVPVQQRGKAVGSLMSGLFAGQLFARLVAGIVGAHAGWRPMYGLAVALEVILLLIVRATLPATQPHMAHQAGPETLPYGQLIRSMARLVRNEPLLREACASGFLLFAAFSALWGSLAFLLARPPYRYGSDVAGLFGLFSLLGMLASPTIGKWTDRYGGRRVVAAGALAVACAFALIAGAAFHLAWLLAGIVVLDFGSRASLVANQSRLLTIASAARSRLNTVFMSCYFAGGACGSSLGAVAAGRYGWQGLAGVGVAAACGALVVLGIGAQRVMRRRLEADQHVAGELR
ncbi:MFS transporter [Trinickia fusca]|nr:MFS transporter [Trinickia fusca]